MRTTRAMWLILVGLSVLIVTTPAPAQTQIGGFGIEGNVEAGWRFFIDEPAKSRRAKWEQYADYPGSAFLGDLQLRIFTPDEKYSLELGGSKWGQDDQEFSLMVGRTGLWDAGFSWDQTPHLLSTDARFLATETSRGVYTLPSTRPALVAYNSAPTLDEIKVRWDTAKIFFSLTPTPDLDIRAEYTRIRKDGNRPFGMAFGSPGNNFYEVLQPIEQTIHDFRLRGTWAKEDWQLQFGYTLSVFQNDLSAVRADNPCFGAVAPAGCGTDATGAPATGQSSLPPDNMAHIFTLGGGVNLPWWRTRVNANFSYSLMLQNQAFLPQTVNPAFAGNPDLALPQDSLNGKVQTILFNIGATSRPIQPLTLSLKYRLFDLSDDSDQIIFQASVLNDRTLAGVRRAPRFSFQRQNADADARWQFSFPVAVTVGGGWEHWTRDDEREVPDSDEAYAKLAVDATPVDWLFGRLTYRPSFRRNSGYNTRAFAELTVIEDPGTQSQGQSVLLRKFDEAERNRQQIDLYLQLTPLRTLTITPTASYRWDDYLSPTVVDPAGGTATFLGVDTRTSWSAGVDVGWTPHERVSFSAGYMHEVNYEKMASRSRPVVGAFALDFADYDWVSNLTDTIDTIYAGVKASIIPKVLDVRFTGSYAYALGRVETRNPVAPTSGSAANNFSAQAKPMPAFEDEQIRLEAALLYHFLKNWTAKVGYVFESFTKHDWRTDGLNPFLPAAGSSIWLGNDLRNYTAHVLTATIAYQFK